MGIRFRRRTRHCAICRSISPHRGRIDRFSAGLGVYDAMFAVGETILSVMAVHLGRDPDFFVSALEDSYSNMRIIYYHAPDAIADVTDFGSR